MNRYLLEQVRNSFNSLGFSPAATYIFLVCLLLILAAIITVVVYNVYQRKKHPAKLPGTIENPDDILNILQWALDERSKIELGFDRSHQQRQTMICSLIETTPTHLTLELPAFVRPSDKWINKTMYAFFSVTLQKRTKIFYSFRSTVLTTEMKSGYSHLTLAFPKIIQLKQKRLHLRIDPPFQDISRLIVWPVSYDENQHLLTNPGQWGEPAAVFAPAKQTPVKIQNISAGGVRLELYPKRMKKPVSFFEKGKYVFIRLELIAPDADLEFKGFLVGKIKNFYQDFQTKSVEIGVQFALSGLMDEETSTISRWQNIDPEIGLEELGNWVFKRHLDLYRNKGIDINAK